MVPEVRALSMAETHIHSIIAELGLLHEKPRGERVSKEGPFVIQVYRSDMENWSRMLERTIKATRNGILITDPNQLDNPIV